MIIRKKELQEVSLGLARGDWYIVYASNGSGKTTFLAQLQQYLTQYKTKYISLRACYGMNLQALYCYLAGVLGLGTAIEDAMGFRQALLGLKENTLILLDDAAGSEQAGSLLNSISALHSESKTNPRLMNLRVILAAGRDLRELTRDNPSCLSTLREYFLPDFTREEVNYLVSCGDYNWNLAEGHPWLTVYLAGKETTLGEVLRDDQNTLINLLRLKLIADLFAGYAQGKWTKFDQSRRLRLLGLAKWQGSELIIRNKIIAALVEEWLTGNSVNLYQLTDREDSINETGCAAAAGKLIIYTASKEVCLGNKLIGLTPVEYRILECLSKNPERIVSRELLAYAAFPEEPVPNAHIESHIKNIRRKLGDKATEPRFIRSRRGFGYQTVKNSFILIGN